MNPLDDAGLYAILHQSNLNPKRSGKGWQCRCPAHEDRTPSLSASASNGRLLLFCHSGCSFDAVRSALGIAKSQCPSTTPYQGYKEQSPAIAPNWRAMVKANRPEEVDKRDRMLGLTPGSLAMIGAVWAVGTNAIAAPMYGAADDPIGVRLRADDGRKWAMPGSRNGLFGLGKITVHPTLYLPEGMTDTAALAGIGLWAVGRPSCTGGRDLVRAMVRALPKTTTIVVVSDNDAPGRAGANLLASELTIDGRRVRVLPPPPRMKDVREWVALGATREMVEFAAANRMLFVPR